MDLKPGWLSRSMRDAHMRCMLNNHPTALRHITAVDTPIPADEASELYDLMNARFKAWTGRDLADPAVTNGDGK